MNPFVCKSVSLSLTKSYIFWKPFILQLIFYTDILIKYEILKKRKENYSKDFSKVVFPPI